MNVVDKQNDLKTLRVDADFSKTEKNPVFKNIWTRVDGAYVLATKTFQNLLIASKNMICRR